MNLFNSIPDQARQYVYLVYALLGVGIGATQTGYVAAEVDQPVWLTVILAVYAFVGTAFGITAAANTNIAPKVPGDWSGADDETVEPVPEEGLAPVLDENPVEVELTTEGPKH